MGGHGHDGGMTGTVPDDPHHGARILRAGVPVSDARAAVVLVHGRGGAAADMLGLVRELDRPDVAYLAPQAVGHTWYPLSFLAPIEQNEPFLGSALALLGSLVDRISDDGLSPEGVVLLGFSQGACLTLEFAARNARRYGGIVAFTGGLIGPHVEDTRYHRSFHGTPVFLGSSDPDPHVPTHRVEETHAIFERMDADVTTRLYPGMGHTVNGDELQHAQRILDDALSSDRPD